MTVRLRKSVEAEFICLYWRLRRLMTVEAAYYLTYRDAYAI